MSFGWRTSRTCNSTARARAASRVSSSAGLALGLSGLSGQRRERRGYRRLEGASSCFTRSRDAGGQPRGIPAGRARLATRPLPTGSPGSVNTIGTVVVSACAACAATVPATTRTSMSRRRSSAASGKLIDHPVCIAVLDDDILALGVAKLVQPLPKHGEEGIRRRTLREHLTRGTFEGGCARRRTASRVGSR